MSDGTRAAAASESAISTQTPFTPGPWRLDCGSYLQHSCCFDWAVVGRDAESGRPFCIAEARGKSDSLLIAAAPDLLRELRAAERWLSAMHSETDDGVETELREVHSAAWEAIDGMRAAIAKATGGQ